MVSRKWTLRCIRVFSGIFGGIFVRETREKTQKKPRARERERFREDKLPGAGFQSAKGGGLWHFAGKRLRSQIIFKYLLHPNFPLLISALHFAGARCGCVGAHGDKSFGKIRGQ